ncbi:MAG: hypothetical protein ACLGHN_11040 [Bacteriovoracia bacterium]
MKKLLFLTLVTIFLVGCDRDYISKKRDGMSPYPYEEESREAQEEKQ